LSPESRLQRLVFAKRAPLEKSLSLPDVQTNVKKRERLLASVFNFTTLHTMK